MSKRKLNNNEKEEFHCEKKARFESEGKKWNSFSFAFEFV
jgi:hypothetical protein